MKCQTSIKLTFIGLCFYQKNLLCFSNILMQKIYVPKQAEKAIKSRTMRNKEKFIRRYNCARFKIKQNCPGEPLSKSGK